MDTYFWKPEYDRMEGAAVMEAGAEVPTASANKNTLEGARHPK